MAPSTRWRACAQRRVRLRRTLQLRLHHLSGRRRVRRRHSLDGRVEDVQRGLSTVRAGLASPVPAAVDWRRSRRGLLALPFVFLVGKRLRGDFAAVGLLVSAVLLNQLVTNFVPLFNGAAGISLVPAPFQASSTRRASVSVRLRGRRGRAVRSRVLLAATHDRVSYGRSLRAMRDNDIVADALGKNLRVQRTSMMVLGG